MDDQTPCLQRPDATRGTPCCAANSSWRYRKQRHRGRSWVVPCTRTSATVAVHSSSCSLKSRSSWNRRPTRKLRRKYCTRAEQPTPILRRRSYSACATMPVECLIARSSDTTATRSVPGTGVRSCGRGRAHGRSPNRSAHARPTMDLFPPVASDHLDLPEHPLLGADRRRFRQHPVPPLRHRGQESSMTMAGDYWVPFVWTRRPALASLAHSCRLLQDPDTTQPDRSPIVTNAEVSPHTNKTGSTSVIADHTLAECHTNKRLHRDSTAQTSGVPRNLATSENNHADRFFRHVGCRR